MSLSHIYLIISTFFILILVYSFLYFIRETKKGKGKIGEYITSYFLKRNLDPSQYKIINTIILKTPKNRFAEIDHLVISRYGIFVIETKNWKGTIWGNENMKRWRQYKDGKQISSPKNPHHQNYGHVQCLKEVLTDYPNINIIPIIAFSGYTKRRIFRDTSMRISQISGEIKSYEKLTITQEQMKSIYSQLLKIKDNSPALKEEHKQYIEKIKKRK